MSKIENIFGLAKTRLGLFYRKNGTPSNFLSLFAVLILLFAIYWIIDGPRIIVAPSQKYDFRETGQIGDTIGGITAPVVGLVSAILVYLSFTAQIRANKIIQQESNFKYIIEEFEKVKKSFKKIAYKSFGNRRVVVEPFKGHFAMLVFTADIERAPELVNSNSGFITETLVKLEFVFRAYSIFISEVNSLNLSTEQKKIIQKKIWLYHEEHINEYFSRIRTWNFPRAVGDEFEPQHKDKLVRAFALKILILTIETDISPFKNSFKDR